MPTLAQDQSQEVLGHVGQDVEVASHQMRAVVECLVVAGTLHPLGHGQLPVLLLGQLHLAEAAQAAAIRELPHSAPAALTVHAVVLRLDVTGLDEKVRQGAAALQRRVEVEPKPFAEHVGMLRLAKQRAQSRLECHLH